MTASSTVQCTASRHTVKPVKALHGYTRLSLFTLLTFIDKLVIISHPAKDRRLSWPQHTVITSFPNVACSGLNLISYESVAVPKSILGSLVQGSRFSPSERVVEFHCHPSESMVPPSGQNCSHCAPESLDLFVHASYPLWPRVGSGVVRIVPLHFLAGCRTTRLNQALSVLSLSLGFF